MAARITPSKGGKPDKLMRDALMLALKREHVDERGKKTSKINAIAAKVVELAIMGSSPHASLIRDTVDGKPMQTIEAGDSLAEAIASIKVTFGDRG